MNFLNKTKRWVLPVYPFLFGIFPVMYLWSANRAQEPAYVVLPALLITLAGVWVIFLLMLAITRSVHRAALVTTLLSLYLLTFGHLYNQVNSFNQPEVSKYLLPLTAVLILAAAVWVVLRRFGSPTLTRALNLVAVPLILFQVITAAPYYLNMARLNRTAAMTASVSAMAPTSGHSQKPIPLTNGKPQRDMYFILLDNYGRQDVLQSGSNFDNSELVQALQERGFVFPNCAQGNYFATAPVISSILNMDYLDKLGIKETAYTRRGGYGDMAPLMQDSEVMRKFHEYGYQTVTFRGFMGLIDIPTSDVYVNFESDMPYNKRLETINFEDLYLKTTAYPFIKDPTINLLLQKGPEFIQQKLTAQKKSVNTSVETLEPQFYQVYMQNLHAFDALEKIPTEVQSPKFVYAHIYTAHWPLMMAPDGSLRQPFNTNTTTAAYVDGVKYTNSRILDAIDSILKNAETEPIIIIQGDHSNGWVGSVEWSGRDRLKILSAYYLPDGGDKMLYDSISPVNNFRLVFKQYFGEQIDLLPDVYHYLDPFTRQMGEAPQTCMSNNLNP